MYLNVSSLFSFLFYLVYEFYLNHIGIFMILSLAATSLSLLIYYYELKKVVNKYPLIIHFSTLILSLIWIWFIANILISLLITISDIINVNKYFLGMTILTYGNSISDLMLNLSLVNLGYSEMALSGSISGPLFNLLIGLGVPLIKFNIKIGNINIEIFNKDNLIGIICLFILIGNLITLGIQAKLNNYHLNNKFAIVRYIFYFLFFIIICYLTFIK